jgi:uncharacterized membrane protein
VKADRAGLVAAVAVLMVVAVAVLAIPVLVQLVLAILLLTLPGLAVSMAILPNTADMSEPLTRAERTLLSLGLSLASVIVIGVVFSVVGIPLTAPTWFIGLVLIVVPAVALILRRTGRRPVIPRIGPNLRPSRLNVLGFGGAGLLLVLAFGIALVGAIQQPRAPYSELWMVALDGQRVSIGVRNEESARTTYRLTLRGPSGITELGPIVLDVHEQWQKEVAVAGTDLELLLYRVDEPGVVYRSVVWGAPPTAET